jgi:3D (Asp-Asp-Asp) domain-containing protein
VPASAPAETAAERSSIKGVRVDLWFPTKRAALAWGWQTLTVSLH